MNDTPLFSVILPCRNQADHIGELLPRYIEALEPTGVSFELVVVPNASRDNTQAVVEACAERESRIRVAPNPLGGWGRSVRVGLEAARGQILCYTNAARTEPSLIPRFLEQFRADPISLLKAKRVQRNAKLREIGSFLYNAEARFLFGVRCGDVNGTPKIFGRDLYESLNLTSPGDLLDLELLSQTVSRGVPIRDIEVPGFKRHGGKSSTTLKSAWGMYFGAVQMRLGLAAGS